MFFTVPTLLEGLVAPPVRVGERRPVLAIMIPSSNPHYTSEAFFRKYKAIGITHVHLAPPGGWAGVEREPGRFDFSRLDAILERLRKVGLKAMVKPGTNTTPEWVWHEGRPHWRLTRADGKTVSQVFKGYPDLICVFDGWGQALKLRYIGALASHLRRRFPDVVEFVGAGELHEGIWCAPPGRLTWTWSDVALAAYRDWLRKRYPSIRAVNEAYGTSWRSFREAVPPRTFEDSRRFWEWYEWFSEAMAAMYYREAATVRRRGFKVHCLAHNSYGDVFHRFVSFRDSARIVKWLDAEAINIQRYVPGYAKGLQLYEGWVGHPNEVMAIYLCGIDGFCVPAQTFELEPPQGRTAEEMFEELREAIRALYLSL